MTQPGQQTLDSVSRQLHQPQAALTSIWHLSNELTMDGIVTCIKSPPYKGRGNYLLSKKSFSSLTFSSLVEFHLLTKPSQTTYCVLWF